MSGGPSGGIFPNPRLPFGETKRIKVEFQYYKSFNEEKTLSFLYDLGWVGTVVCLRPPVLG